MVSNEDANAVAQKIPLQTTRAHPLAQIESTVGNGVRDLDLDTVFGGSFGIEAGDTLQTFSVQVNKLAIRKVCFERAFLLGVEEVKTQTVTE